MKHILVVDDDRLNLVLAYDTLKPYYSVSVVNSGVEALRFLESKDVDLILLDIEMPVMNGIETLKKIKSTKETAEIPVIFLTGLDDSKIEAQCIELGAQDYIIKPFYAPGMLVRIRRILELNDLRKNLENLVQEKTKEIEYLTIQTITTFADFIDAKDRYTKFHSQHVAKLAEKMAVKLGWDRTDVRNLYYSALLHDIGKIGVPDYILNKPGKLTEEEYAIIKKHPVIGGEILSEVTVVPYLSIGAGNHHEKYDGTGYPLGKKGKEIPLVGRIVGIADTVDAMTSTRSYREGLGVQETIDELNRCSGTQFDPELVPIMIEILQEGIEFDEEEQQVVGSHLVSAVLNEYSKAAQTDRLSGLWSKQYLQIQINEILHKSLQGKALVLVEIDNYRRVSQICGHGSANAMIVCVAEGIRKELKSVDLAGRIDDDKFVILLNDMEKEQLEIKLLKLQKNMKSMIKELGLAIKVGISLGAAMAPDSGRDYFELYHNADKAVYFVKQDKKKDFFVYCEAQENEISDRLRAESEVDIWHLKVMLSESSSIRGVYHVDTLEFEKIFKLMQRKSKRSGEMQSLLLFSLQAVNSKNEIYELEEALKKLHHTLNQSLRNGDITAKINLHQYAVLISGADRTEADSVAQRILLGFEKINDNKNLRLLYEVEAI